MAEIGLAEVTKSFRSAMGETAGSFRKAANDNNAVIGKITKDLSKMFGQQRAAMSALNDNIEEVAQHSQQTSIKVDKLSNILSESVTIQSQMFGELKKISSGISILDNSMNQMQNSISGLGSNTVTGWLSKLFTLFQVAQTGINAIAIGISGLAGADMIRKQLSGQDSVTGGGDTSIHKTGPEKQAIGKELGQNLMRDFGLTNYQAAGVLGHFGHESGFDPGVNEKKPLVANSRGGYGLAQWTGPRRKQLEAFAASHNMPVNSEKTQYEFLKQEPAFKTYIEKVKQTRSMEEATQAFLPFETGGDPRAIVAMGDRLKWGRTAMGWLNEKNQQATSDNSSQSSKPVEQNSQSPITPQSAPMSPASGGESSQSHSGHSHGEGIISGAKEGGQQGGSGGGHGKLSGVNPDILNKFKQIESQSGGGLTVTSGYRSPEHNARVGGAKNSAHMRGNAVDVVFGGGTQQALKLIDTASKVGIGGIGVYSPSKLHFDTESKRAWGPTYHSDSIPSWAQGAIQKHLGGKGGDTGKETTPSSGGGQVTPGSTPMSSGGGESGGGGGGGSGAEQQAPDTSAAIQAMTGMSAGSIESAAASLAAGGTMGGMMGGTGNFVGAAASLMGGGMSAGSLLSILGPMLNNTMPEQTSGDAEMLQSLSQTSESAQQLNRTAMVNEAQQQLNAEKAAQSAVEKSQEDVNAYNANRKEGFPVAFDYNHPDDHRWPDWVFNTQYRGYRDIQDPIKTG